MCRLVYLTNYVLFNDYLRPEDDLLLPEELLPDELLPEDELPEDELPDEEDLDGAE